MVVSGQAARQGGCSPRPATRQASQPAASILQKLGHITRGNIQPQTMKPTNSLTRTTSVGLVVLMAMVVVATVWREVEGRGRPSYIPQSNGTGLAGRQAVTSLSLPATATHCSAYPPPAAEATTALSVRTTHLCVWIELQFAAACFICPALRGAAHRTAHCFIWFLMTFGLVLSGRLMQGFLSR